MKYNMNEIMKSAWNYFNGIWGHEEVESDSTFAQCLRISWKVAKEEMEEAKEREAQLSKSEYVKAFDWACRKLNVTIDMSARQKETSVIDESRNSWNKNVWSEAMRAVERIIELNLYAVSAA